MHTDTEATHVQYVCRTINASHRIESIVLDELWRSISPLLHSTGRSTCMPFHVERTYTRINFCFVLRIEGDKIKASAVVPTIIRWPEARYKEERYVRRDFTLSSARTFSLQIDTLCRKSRHKIYINFLLQVY